MDEKPKNKYWRFLAGFLGMIVGVMVLYGLVSPWFAPKQTQPQPQKPDEIVITKLSNGDQLVENRTQSSSLKVPSGWFIDGTKQQFFGEPSKDNGCKISSLVSMSSGIVSIEELKQAHEKDLQDIGVTVRDKEYAVVKVSGHDALRLILSTEENGYSVTINVPVSGKIYSYVLYSDPDVVSKCNASFDSLLATVQIS